MGKGLRGFDRRRWTNKQATIAAFKAILRDPQARKPFGPEWFDALASRVERQRSTLLKIIGVSLVPTGYLALFLLDIRADVEVFGFKFEDRTALFEVALLATCLLGLYAAGVAVSMAQGEQLLDVWLDKSFGKTSAGIYRFALDPSPFKPPPFTDPPGPRFARTPSVAGIRGGARVAFYSVAGLVALAAAVTQVWAIGWALLLGGHRVCGVVDHVCHTNPSPSIWIVAFCAVTTILNVAAYAAYGIPQRYHVGKP